LGIVGAALAIDQPELDSRIRLMTVKFQEMQARPETAIPAELLHNAKGIVFLDRTKAGFLLAFQGGSGVALAKPGKSDDWSPAAFVGASEISLGFQAGGEQGFYAFVLMDTNALTLLTMPNYHYGSEARGTAGDSSGGAESVISPLKPWVLVYSDRHGLYGGADLKAGGIEPDDRANLIYYGQTVSMADILLHEKVKSTDASLALAKALNDHSRPAEAFNQRGK
jgi:lipid-binding SYLF domain-containing protein